MVRDPPVVRDSRKTNPFKNIQIDVAASTMAGGGPKPRKQVVVSRKHGLSVATINAEKEASCRQHKEALQFCHENPGVKAKKCLTLNPGRWSLVSKDSLHRRLTEQVKSGFEYSSLGMLTPNERQELADCMQKAGKAGCGFNRQERDEAVVQILKYRDCINKKGGRKFVKLTKGAQQCIDNNKPGKVFWKSFFVEFSHMIHITKQKITSIQRLKQCTTAVAAKHVKDLIKVLTKKGIYDPVNHRVFVGKEGNIIWQDEMGQFFNYHLLKGNAANVVGAKGVPAKHAEAENRQQFSYDGAIGADMFLYDLHLLFRGEHFSADMTPPSLSKQEFAMFSMTDKGCQISSTFLARQKNLLAQARARGIQGDIVFVTDGHASRFSIDLLKWLEASKSEDESCVTGNDMYITPPNATGTCCVLDQLFQALHRVYGSKVRDAKKVHGMEFAIGKWEAIEIMVGIHEQWCSNAEKHRAFKVCGLEMASLLGGVSTISIDHFPPQNFVVSDAAMASPLAIEAPPNAEPPPPPPPFDVDSSFASSVGSYGAATPSPSLDRNGLAYFKEKLEIMGGALGHAREALNEAEGLRVQALHYSPCPTQGGVLAETFGVSLKREHVVKNFRITSVSGSLMGSGLLQMRTDAEAKIKEADDAKALEIASRRETYERCVNGCEYPPTFFNKTYLPS